WRRPAPADGWSCRSPASCRDPVSTGPGGGPTSFAGSFSESFRHVQRHFGRSGKLNLCHPDDSDLAARPGALMGGIAVGEIAVGMGIGAAADALDAGYAGSAKLRFDEPGQVEMGLAACRNVEMMRAARVQGEKIGPELIPDLVIGRMNGGPIGGKDAGGIGPQFFHGGDDIADNAVDSAAPSGMGGADNAGFGIGQED